jgi:hypothetical protein
MDIFNKKVDKVKKKILEVQKNIQKYDTHNNRRKFVGAAVVLGVGVTTASIVRLTRRGGSTLNNAKDILNEFSKNDIKQITQNAKEISENIKVLLHKGVQNKDNIVASLNKLGELADTLNITITSIQNSRGNILRILNNAYSNSINSLNNLKQVMNFNETTYVDLKKQIQIAYTVFVDLFVTGFLNFLFIIY